MVIFLYQKGADTQCVFLIQKALGKVSHVSSLQPFVHLDVSTMAVPLCSLSGTQALGPRAPEHKCLLQPTAVLIKACSTMGKMGGSEKENSHTLKSRG